MFSAVSIQVDSDIDWLIVNPKQFGFYRVNYPGTYWDKLIATQETNHEASYSYMHAY